MNRIKTPDYNSMDKSDRPQQSDLDQNADQSKCFCEGAFLENNGDCRSTK